ncbi:MULTISPECIES: mechanosensitive ion channel family protein [Ferroplasma]|jgi:small-conductance mechanosensitive channel|uniref:Mechanosensitive ion channel n=2 Tax=Ferroplasma TaxID=74968 RepID=S0APY5_FERAC|nr:MULTISPECIES: mechanosensitive ion channel domain-containing protein [Ferroplasma]MCL4348595.1 mechanosensitive ion channel family protein [Candidatus Thermoplasmatota archaeon]AGO61313.1 mechanosensitive ion channel [Ferroplasma acidarmanus Fer1]ARD84267.1 mechanosensitive ion channel [Ferroplasma acidiphilum]NOL59504.1 mechanosensitive ion channel family protein [Ferroplasma acidiphilum]WMT53172.1 MAG: mechanosensitive ion channel [Ferroplasma acidiphilum]
MAIDKHKLGKMRNEVLKIVVEVIIGIVLALLAGFAIDIVINKFLPQYKSYQPFIVEAVHAVIILIIGFLVVGSFLKYLKEALIKTNRSLYGVSLIIRIVFYIIILALVMSAFHISVTGILAGSAIGGVVLGLAVQTVASNLLSSIFATSTNTIKYGEVISVNSWVWSIETTGKIIDVKTLFSQMLTKDNNIIYLPNSEILGNSVITEFRTKNGSYTYPLNITVQADVPADQILSQIKENNDFSDIKFFLSTKNGVSNTFEALIVFNEVTELNEKIARANNALDSAYWNIKSKFNVLGPNAMWESPENVYPLTVTLNSDVPSEKLIDEAIKQIPNSEVILLTRGASTNVYLAKVKIAGKEVDKVINDTNLSFERIYNKLKADNDNTHKDDTKKQ